MPVVSCGIGMPLAGKVITSVEVDESEIHSVLDAKMVTYKDQRGLRVDMEDGLTLIFRITTISPLAPICGNWS